MLPLPEPAVDFSLTSSLLLGAIPGVYVGARLSAQAPAGFTRPVVAGALAGSSLALLEVPGVVIVLGSAGAAALSIWAGRAPARDPVGDHENLLDRPCDTTTTPGAMDMDSLPNQLVVRSNQYYREGSLDTERWAKIAEIPDYDEVIDSFDWSEVLDISTRRPAILDCGCGLGHFPQQLINRGKLPADVTFDYDTLDPSSYSLTQHRVRLQRPFMPRHSYHSSIEEWSGGGETYDLIWCMHSLYTVSSSALPMVLANLRSVLRPSGRCLIYLPEKRSSYMALFDLHLEDAAVEQDEPYLAAEEVVAELQTQGRHGVDLVSCTFEHKISVSEPDTLATYLNQICLRTEPLTYTEWYENDVFARYLAEALDPVGSQWVFEQNMKLISFS